MDLSPDEKQFQGQLLHQDNRLEHLPPELFSLPSLTTLDVANNKLRELPAAMWTAPALTDLNAALNHLRELPDDDIALIRVPNSEATVQRPTDSVFFNPDIGGIIDSFDEAIIIKKLN